MHNLNDCVRLGVEIGLTQDAILDAVDFFEHPSSSLSAADGPPSRLGGPAAANDGVAPNNDGGDQEVSEDRSGSFREGKSSSSRGSSLELMLSQVLDCSRPLMRLQLILLDRRGEEVRRIASDNNNLTKHFAPGLYTKQSAAGGVSGSDSSGGGSGGERGGGGRGRAGAASAGRKRSASGGRKRRKEKKPEQTNADFGIEAVDYLQKLKDRTAARGRKRDQSPDDAEQLLLAGDSMSYSSKVEGSSFFEFEVLIPVPQFFPPWCPLATHNFFPQLCF